MLVRFRGEDRRSGSFDVAGLPLPGWHAPLAAAFAARVGPAGGLRTLASAQSTWDVLARFLRFLGETAEAPTDPSRLTRAYVHRFVLSQGQRSGAYVWGAVRQPKQQRQ